MIYNFHDIFLLFLLLIIKILILLLLFSRLWDPIVYPNPKQYLPERWLTTDNDSLQAMETSFIAFGSGPRKW